MKNLFNYIIGTLSLLTLTPFASADGGGFHMMDGFGGGGMGFGFISMLIFWGVIIYLAVIAFKYFTGKKDEETPLEILKKRLAKGEISEAEFEKLKKKL